MRLLKNNQNEDCFSIINVRGAEGKMLYLPEIVQEGPTSGLFDHCQAGIQGNPDSDVKGYLETETPLKSRESAACCQ